MTLVLAAAPCPHPYFPLTDGLNLTYRAGRSHFDLAISGVTSGGADASKGQIEVRYKDRVGKANAECSAEGVKTEFGGLEGLALQAGGVDAKILSSEGLLLPPPDQMTPGKSWKNKVAMEVKPPKLGITLQTTLAKESIVVGEETITVQAGTFKALKLLNKTVASSGDVGMERAIESFMWVAPGIGIVKLQTGNSVDLELLKVNSRGTEAARQTAPPPKAPKQKKLKAEAALPEQAKAQ